MKLASITLSNVKSFREETRLELEKGLNILVGPNGGGKSNLLDAITVIIRRNVLKGYQPEDAGQGQQRIRETRHFRSLTDFLPKYSGNEENPQIIELELILEEADVQNIRILSENIELIVNTLDTFENMSANRLQFVREWEPDQFEADSHITVRVTDGQDEWIGDDPEHTNWWKQYLTHFELFSILFHEARGPRLYPAFLYFSPFRGSAQPSHFHANLSSSAYAERLAGYYRSTSQSSTSLIQAASLYFAEKRRMLESNAQEKGFSREWEEDREVQLVSKHFERLGYGWTLELIDHRQNLYELNLMKGDTQFDIAQSSSGEKEIVNYILGIFALHLRDGLLAIDEVELHLHPRWQSLLLDILFQLVEDTGNQIILSTHSPIFITPRSVAHVIRVFQDVERGSQLIKIDDPQDQKVKDTVHIINAHNNAKMFFADKVILVEGIQDRLVFERIANLFRDIQESTAVVEVLEVHGKHNFDRYKSFLSQLDVANAIIADFDYIFQLGEGAIRELFVTDQKRIDANVLKNKKSRDRATLASLLEDALEDKDLEGLTELWQYIKSRHRRLKANLSQAEEKLLEAEISNLHKQGVYLLRQGEIEDYLPDGARDVEGVVELAKGWEFEAWLLDRWDDGAEELVCILAEIVNASDEDFEALKAILSHRVETQYSVA